MQLRARSMSASSACAARRFAAARCGPRLRVALALAGALIALGPGAARGDAVDQVLAGLPPLPCLDGPPRSAESLPLALLCGRDPRLDQTIDEFLGGGRTRAGHVHARIARRGLTAAGGQLPAAEIAALQALALLDESTDTSIDEVVILAGLRHAIARALVAIKERDPSLAPEVDLVLGEIFSADGVPLADTLNVRFPRLLDGRPDRDRSGVLAPGFDTLAAADTVFEMALGMAEHFAGIPVDAVTGRPILSHEAAFVSPLFIGPDGVRDTADDLPVVRCPPGSVSQGSFGGARCDSPSGPVEPLYYLTIGPGGVPAPTGLSDAECRQLLPNTVAHPGGLNANGECIQLSNQIRIGSTGNAASATLTAIDALRDPALRPETATLEPTVLTDLRLRAEGRSIAARPLNPGGLRYPNVERAPFARRVDPNTGAPVRAEGEARCEVRLRPDPETGFLIAVGPDGDPATQLDNATPSSGNCLLYDDPEVAGGAQQLRSPASIALDHAADQTRFHTLCSHDFDEDRGQCSLDWLNDTVNSREVTLSLSGIPGLQPLLITGLESVRAPSTADPLDRDRYRELGDDPGVNGPVRAAVLVLNHFAPSGLLLPFSDVLTTEQQALLGCGPAFASGCDYTQSNSGGIDLLNADASVLLQESTILKVLSAGALVGARSAPGEPFEAGILGRSVMTPEGAASLGSGATLEARERLAQKLFRRSLSQLSDAELTRTATDLQIEPVPWQIDSDALAEGIILFENPLGPDGKLDPTRLDPEGESCTAFFAGAEVGCTVLERLSANIERILIAQEIIGVARVLDPPETAAEIRALIDGDPENDLRGDPVAGPDGIRFANFDADGNGRIEDGDLAGDQRALINRQNVFVADDFAGCQSAGAALSACYRNLEAPLAAPGPAQGRLVGALPLGFRLRVRREGDSAFSTELVPIQLLTPLELQTLELEQVLKIDAARFGYNATDLNGDGVADVTIRSDRVNGAFGVSLRNADVDANGVRDLDEDADDAFDFIDDGTAGPIATVNPFCGSGLPSDILQDAMQFELDPVETARLSSLYPAGLPPRSPVFCASLLEWIGWTGPVAPGRRAFLWHGAAPEADPDGDGFAAAYDSCPLIANPEQGDLDSDGVGDACDVCPEIANPRVTTSETASWMTLVNGQRDDDADGAGNACDFTFASAANPLDDMRSSLGKSVQGHDCGVSGDLPCAWFDHDGTGASIGPGDVALLRGGAPAQSCGPACVPPFSGGVGSAACEGPGC